MQAWASNVVIVLETASVAVPASSMTEV